MGSSAGMTPADKPARHGRARKADDMTQTTTTRTATCPGCSGFGRMTDNSSVLQCNRCGGFFTAEPITREEAADVIAIQLPMLGNAGPDGQFYFDLDILAADCNSHSRIHGWADMKTRRVVQWG
jgi:DnaJ-class molecular chaperone